MQGQTVEDLILTKFLTHLDKYASGTDLATEFNVSRNAIWKAVNELREQGYEIESSPTKGYRLISLTKALDGRQILHGLPEIWENLQIETHQVVTSTNDLAKQFAIEQPGREALIISKKQTKGRGRSGRDFYSQLTNGLYFSLVLVPKNIELRYVPLYTLAAATAIIEAVKKEWDLDLEVKWVNDLFYKKRKISGILSEAISDIENNNISAIIVGIGLNIAGSFSEADSDIQRVAGTLFEKMPQELNVNQLLQQILIKFGKYHDDIPAREFLPIYEEHLLGINKEVYFTQNNVSHQGLIRGVNEEGHLLVENNQGEIMELLGQDIHFSSQQFIE